VKNITPLFILLLSLAAQAQTKNVTGMYCFVEGPNAEQALALVNRQYQLPMMPPNHHLNRMREQLEKQRPQLELVTDTVDSFGRKFCLISTDKKLREKDLRIIATHQVREDDVILAKNRKLALSLKDPWGGEKLDLSGKPRAFRTCHKNEAAKSDELTCEDLIITAKKGEDNVIEYRFWLGFQSGDGLSVYKSANNHLELSKVMAQMKKDKQAQKYSFAPKGSSDSELIEDAKLGGE
jgi:hypothetical protein